MQIQARLDELTASMDRQEADGDLLEELVEDAGPRIPSWELRHCWAYGAWPDRERFDEDPHDDGIDLVAEKTDGDLVAIQCKARSSGNVTPTDIQKFAGRANPETYQERWLVTTTELTTGNERALAKCNVIWKNALVELTQTTAEPAATEVPDPRTAMQDEAVSDCIAVLRQPPSELAELWREQGASLGYLPANVGRAKLILPCGTGKTRVSMRIVNELCADGALAVVLVPSIALIGQVRRAYLEGLRAAARATTTIAVCSDKTANAVRPGEEEKGTNDVTRDTSHTHAVEISCKVASDPDRVVEFLNNHAGADRLAVIFSTYQSAHHVAAALTQTERYAEVLVCDEAHRTAQILDHDYKPVFQPARRVATVIRDSEYRTAGWRAVRRLIEWAEENTDYYQQMGMEYAGQLFSRVMGHQAADGAYFTRPEAARLLAELALDQTSVERFSDPREWLKLKATDLACGSGTLLDAWIESGKDRIRAEGGDEQRCAMWHKKAVEQLTTGLDINPVSLQMAAGRFILGNLSVDYRKISLYELAHGRTSDGNVRLGTLELLGDDEIVGSAPETFVWEDDDIVDPDTKAALGNTKVVLTNPPFSDNTKRNQNVDEGTKRAMQQREKDLRDRVVASNEAAGRQIHFNSIQTFFTPVADCVLDPDDGVLANILPMTACTGGGAAEQRRFLASRFWIKYVVMCHDPKNINLSQATNINECLLIGTRRGAGQGKPTTFVNLARYPLNTEDARAIAAAIREGNFDAIGRATSWASERVESGDWSPVQWYSAELAAACTELREDASLATAGALYEFGVQGRNVEHCFEPIEGNPRTQGRLGILTSIAEERRSCLAGDADEVWQIMPVEKRDKRGGTDAVPKYVDEKGWALAAQRFRTTSSRTASQYTAEPALGTAYIAIRTDTPDEAKTLNLLWNSTPVLVQLLSMRAKSAAYIHWKPTQLQSVKLPPDARDPELVRTLAAVHDKLAETEIGRLQNAADDSVRAAIDDAVSELFGLTTESVSEWRTWLSQEPFMHNTSPVDD